MNRVLGRLRLRCATRLLLCIAPVWGCTAEREAAVSETATTPLDPNEREWFVEPLLRVDATGDDQFGFAVGLSGNTAVVSAPQARKVYVFVLADDGWQEQTTLVPPSDATDRYFGESLAISGNTVVVGARANQSASPGAAYVYVRSGNDWGAATALVANDEAVGDDFGASVAIAGDTVVVGAPRADTGMDEDPYGGAEGAAYVFTRSGIGWSQPSKLFLSDGLGLQAFGSAVAVSETTVLVGAPQADSDRGHVHFFTRTGSGWSAPQRDSLDVLRSGFELGCSLALGDDLAVVGARKWQTSDSTPPVISERGAAFVYTRTASGWLRSPGELLADDAVARDWLGSSVAVSEDQVLVGAPGADTTYLWSPRTSSSVAARIGSRGENARFGSSVALAGGVAVIGTEFGQASAYVAELLVPDGGACDENSDCRARHCVEGVCCNVACSGACEGCGTGVCSAVPGEAAPSCGLYLCGDAPGDCPKSCAVHTDCIETAFCRDVTCQERVENGGACSEKLACVSESCIDGVCRGTRNLGTPCSSSADCASNHCVDGFCCNQACEGQCEACDVEDAHGSCTPVEKGPPHRERNPCESDGTLCGGECDGEHTTRCNYPASETSCGSSCADDHQTDRACNGHGACVEQTPVSCKNYRCSDEDTCRESCETSSECAADCTCQDGRCEVGAYCVDPERLEEPGERPRSCSPYLCERGSCTSSCEGHRDCAATAVCERHECTTEPLRRAASATEESGCSIARRKSPGSGSALSGLLLLAACAVRRVWRGRRRAEGGPYRHRTGRKVWLGGASVLAVFVLQCSNDAENGTAPPSTAGTSGSDGAGAGEPGGASGASGASGDTSGSGGDDDGGSSGRGGTQARGGTGGRNGGGTSGNAGSGPAGEAGAGGSGAGEAGSATGGVPAGGEGGAGEAGAPEPGCQDPPSTRLCSGNLDSIKTGDFEVKFTIRAGTQRADYAVIGQRASCEHGYFWSARLIDGSLVFELDDNDSNYVECRSPILLNDQRFHRVVVRRASGILSIVVDCGQPYECRAPTDLSRPMGPLNDETNDPCVPDRVAPLNGNVLDRCVRPL